MFNGGWLAAVVVISGLACIVWWLHAALNRLNPPNDGILDLAMFYLVTACKWVVWLSLPLVMRRICFRLHGDSHALKRCLAYWLAGFLVLIATLAALHDLIAWLLSNDAIRLYYISPDSPLQTRNYLGREEWLPRWHSGEVILLESILGVLIIGLIAGTAYRFGSRYALWLLLCPAIVLILSGWVWLVGLSLWDYDFFIGSLFSDCLLLDTIWPVTAIDPTTQIGMTVWFAFILTTFLALRPLGPKASKLNEHS
jgi:hypothetical protein